MSVKKMFRRRKKRTEGSNATPAFFQADPMIRDHGEGNAFFLPREGEYQAKLKVSEPGDEHEKEADRMADKVVSRKAEEEKLQKAGEKDEDKLHRKTDEEKDKKISRKGKHSHDSEQTEDLENIATKPIGGTKSKQVSPANLKTQDTGSNLPATTAKEMNSHFGYDFSNVKIHTGQEAGQLNEQLRAQAFTYGGEIFFNQDKFNPHSTQGKWLLAHELTHVVQQKGQDLNTLQKKDVPGISTPVPDEFKLNKEKEVLKSAEGEINGVKVVIVPDTKGPVRPGKSAETSIGLTYSLPGMNHENGKVVKVNGQATVVFRIHTQYLPDVKPSSPSAYGKGTTAEDKKAGNTSLKFHEASHGLDAMAYLSANPLPNFTGKTGMTKAQFEKAKADFIKQITAYQAKLLEANKQAVDCTGIPESGCKN